MSVCILGIGTAVPELSIEQADAAEAAGVLCGLTEKQRRLLPTLYRHAGVRKRHTVLLTPEAKGQPGGQVFYRSVEEGGPDGPTTAARMQKYAQSATGLATAACQKALADASLDAGAITHLITVSCSGFAAPGVDIQLIRTLGLPPDVARTHVGFMGCHGALNALRVARAFADANPDARILVCAIELCSLHHQYGWHPEQIVANALFADGSAALVCGHADDHAPHEEKPRWLASGSTVVPETEDLMSWNIGDHGFQMTLSARVPDVIQGSLRTWLESWLASEGTDLGQIAHWGIHPGGPRILQACVDALQLEPSEIQTSKEVLAEFGNMSSPTILFIVERLIRNKTPGPCVLLAFGPGLTIEAALVEPSVRPSNGKIRREKATLGSAS
ncbi:MAG TPA: type III polyketide synthase [Planctomycetaceae bacterium]|jgi:prepilin-type processing-associated H-X9-DG protein|nr:type III polyketide synthase [Planctomycetaceae bacterium]